MLSRITTFTLVDLEPARVQVEVDVRPGLPTFTIVGLGDRAVREARERVQAAIVNSGLDFPDRRITVNLAPASLRKAGPGFDLAIACGVLAASGVLRAGVLDGIAVYGELGLGGELRAVRGGLAVAEGAARTGLERLVVPHRLCAEAGLVDGLAVHGAASLRGVVALLHGQPLPEDAVSPSTVAVAAERLEEALPDLADVRGHAAAIEALTIAAAGGHNLLLTGPPGTGKTMLARRLPSILPPLTPAEALEVTRIQSAVGMRVGGGLATRRPFRAPHHTISAAGLVGGGAGPFPGEVTFACHGVLFLDELSEFARPALEALRQPLEDGRVAIVRGQRTAIFPSRLTLVAATNPCPCGMLGADGRCRCSPADHERHRRRLSGPLLDRIDLLVRVERPTGAELAAPPLATSASARERVLAARERQTARLDGSVATCNAQLDTAEVRRHVVLEDRAERMLRTAYDRGTLSARGRLRVLRLARTVADLGGQDAVGAEHLATAMALHQHDTADAAVIA